MKFDANHLYLHVIGAGNGECNVVHIPGTGWGVVDCGRGTIALASSFLEDMGVEKLRFVILTHPHQDHMHDLEDLIAAFEPDKLFRYDGDGILEFKGATLFAPMTKKSLDTARGAAATLARLQRSTGGWSEWHYLNDERKPILGSARLLGGGNAPHSVSLDILAPNDIERGTYLEGCDRLNLGVNIDWRKQDPLINGISVVASIRYGETRVLLGGDLPKNMSAKTARGHRHQDGKERCWKRVVLDHPDKCRRLAAVKVSHHGSETSFFEKAWTLHSDRLKKSPIAIVTSFNSSPLPSAKALNEIGQYSNDIYVLGAHPVELAADSPLKMLNSTAGMRLVDNGAGAITLVFDENNDCLHRQSAGNVQRLGPVG